MIYAPVEPYFLRLGLSKATALEFSLTPAQGKKQNTCKEENDWAPGLVSTSLGPFRPPWPNVLNVLQGEPPGNRWSFPCNENDHTQLCVPRGTKHRHVLQHFMREQHLYLLRGLLHYKKMWFRFLRKDTQAHSFLLQSWHYVNVELVMKWKNLLSFQIRLL